MVLPAPRATPVTVAQTPASERNGRFSSDGRWIAYQSDQTGRNEIYVQPFPGTIDQRQRVSLNGGTSPQWGRKGRELYFMSADNHLMVAAANPTSEKGSLEFNTPKQLFRSPLPQGTEYDTTLDGDRFLILSPAGEPPPIIVLSNWIPER
jgi:serine/threonine-protein kinase